MRSFYTRHPFVFFFLAALLIRGILLFVFPLPDLTGGDFNFYNEASLHLVAEGDFGGATYLAPGWSIFLALVHVLGGTSVATLVAVAVLISSFLVVTIVALGREFFDDRVARCAGFVALVWPPFLIETFVYGLSNLFYVLIFSLAVFVFIRAQRTGSLTRAALSGSLFGFAVLTDSSGLFLPVFLLGVGGCRVIYLLIRGRAFARSVFRTALVFCVFYAFIVGLWSYRNMHVFEGASTVPIVVKDTEKELFTKSGIYGTILEQGRTKWVRVLFASARFFILPHNLSILSPYAPLSHKEGALRMFGGDMTIVKDAPIVLVKIFFTLLQIALVCLFALSLWRFRRSRLAVFTSVSIFYGLSGSIVFGLLQQNGIADVEPISRFFFPYIPLVIVMVSGFLMEQRSGTDSWMRSFSFSGMIDRSRGLRTKKDGSSTSMNNQGLTSDFIKDLYDKQVPNKYQHYEFDRWLADTGSWIDYVMTHQSIAHHLRDITFSRVLELGPGPGTWTRLLYRHNSSAQFDLVDISEVMQKEFEREMRGGHPSVKYIVHDFLTCPLEGRYDLFFSSRAIEYFDDKQAVVRKVREQLVSGGKGIIITKNRGFNRDGRLQHSAQLVPDEFAALLQSEGLLVDGVFPCVIRIPIIGRLSSRLSLYVFERLFTRPFKQRYSRFVESFIVVFSKP